MKRVVQRHGKKIVTALVGLGAGILAYSSKNIEPDHTSVISSTRQTNSNCSQQDTYDKTYATARLVARTPTKNQFSYATEIIRSDPRALEALTRFASEGKDTEGLVEIVRTLTQYPDITPNLPGIIKTMREFRTVGDYRQRMVKYFEELRSDDEIHRQSHAEYPLIFFSNTANLEGLSDLETM